MKLTFDEFRKILSEEGLNPSIGVLNRVWSAVQNRLNPPLTASAIEECVTVWAETLKRFKAQRPIMPQEKAAIGRAIQANGSELVELALYGARYEQGSDKFNPAQHLSVIRVLDPKNFARFASIGSQEKAKRSQAPVLPPMPEPVQAPAIQAQQEPVEPEKVPMTPEARKLLASLGLVKPVAHSEEDTEKRRELLRRQAEMLAREGRT